MIELSIFIVYNIYIKYTSVDLIKKQILIFLRVVVHRWESIMKNEEMMQKSSMGKLFIKMCIPAIMIMLVIVIYNMADIFFIGKTGDMKQVAAVSLAASFFAVLQGVGTLLGGGGSTAISIALGKKDEKRVKYISSFCFYTTLLIGFIIGGVTIAYAYPIALKLGATEDIIKHTVIYIKILAIGAPIILLANVYANIIRADGSVKQSMIANILGTLVNIVLDPIFILVLNMGVKGAAIATVIGNMASCVYLLYYIIKKQQRFSIHIKDFILKYRVPAEVITLGIPLALSTVLMSFSHIFTNKLLIGYGDTVIAATGVASKAGMLIVMIVMGICMGMQPAVSYSYGAKDLKRMKKIIKSTGMLTVITGSILTIICFIFRNKIIMAFVDDLTILEYGQKIITASLVTGPIIGLYQLSTMFLQATGKVSYATIVSILKSGVLYVPVVIMMNTVFGLNGLIYAGSITDVFALIIGGILAIIWYKKIKNDKEGGQMVSKIKYTLKQRIERYIQFEIEMFSLRFFIKGINT